jgi:N-carbamoyl-L-amino-acid hydrolase
MDTDTGLAQRLFERLRDATGDGVGISRESYGAGESVALDIVEGAAHT